MSDELHNDDATQPVPANLESNPASRGGAESTQPVAVGETSTRQAASPDDQTQPLKLKAAAESPQPDTAEKPVRLWRGRLIFIALGFVLIAILVGGFLGYNQGVDDRVKRFSSEVAMAAATQFQLGLDDIANQRYEMARGRFEYVIKIDPTFPGVKEKLTEVLIALIPTTIPTATLTPTPAFTPTPDLRGEEEVFNQIKKLLSEKNWDTAIATIEALRTKNLKYKTIEVDGFYYIALRNRGVVKILQQGDLEGGTYDLALAERFGPLDRDADSYRLFARLYVTGASFWQVDWEKATNYFSQVYPYLPNLRDSSNIFAIDRYRQAASKYAEKLYSDGDACRASKLLDTIFQNNYRNSTVEPLATRAFGECHPPTETPQPSTNTPTSTPTLSATVTRLTPVGPTFTRTPTTSGPTVTPSATTGSANTSTPTPTSPPAAPTATPPPPTATHTPTPTKGP
jgi:tetratricopeptide (TPR) repeat protein